MSALISVGACGAVFFGVLALGLGVLLWLGYVPARGSVDSAVARADGADGALRSAPARTPQRALGAALFLWWVPAVGAGLGLLWRDGALAVACGGLWLLGGICVVACAYVGALEAVPAAPARAAAGDYHDNEPE